MRPSVVASLASLAYCVMAATVPDKRVRDPSTVCIVSALSTIPAFQPPIPLHVVTVCWKLTCLIVFSLFLLGSRIICRRQMMLMGTSLNQSGDRTLGLCVKRILNRILSIFYNIYIYTIVLIPYNLRKARNYFEVHLYEPL